MTQHDPFSYGQVSLGSGSKKPANESPDELLFADAGPTKKGPPADASWELPETGTSAGFSPGVHSQETAEFAADILGESERAPAPAAKPQPAAARPAVARPQPQPAAPAARAPVAPPVAAPAAAKVLAPAAASSATPAAAPRVAPRPVRAVQTLPPRPARPSSTAVPAALLVGGAGLAAWLYLGQHNLVMAGIVGALSLVGAVFARVWLRG
jgi:hypothetical protein